MWSLGENRRIILDFAVMRCFAKYYTALFQLKFIINLFLPLYNLTFCDDLLTLLRQSDQQKMYCIDNYPRWSYKIQATLYKAHFEQTVQIDKFC